MRNFYKGNYFFLNEDYEKALYFYNQEKKVSKYLFLYKGIAYYRIGDIEKAIKNLEVAHSFDKYDAYIGIALGVIYILNGEEKSALIVLANLRNDNASRLINRIRSGRYDGIEKFIKLPPVKYKKPINIRRILFLGGVLIFVISGVILFTFFFINKDKVNKGLLPSKDKKILYHRKSNGGIGFWEFQSKDVIFSYSNPLELTKDIIKLRELIDTKRYNRAIILSNKILLSDAPLSKKYKVKFMRTFIKPITDPYKLRYNPKLSDIIKEPLLYISSYIFLKGKVIGIDTGGIILEPYGDKKKAFVYVITDKKVPIKIGEFLGVLGRVRTYLPSKRMVYIYSVYIERVFEKGDVR
jgi:hypothetical protein